jgi:LmbE family N-acetylglucosaminyl deacetylase
MTGEGGVWMRNDREGSITPPAVPVVWMTPPRGNILVLAPHPDDETLGCGGAVALHCRQGDRVKIVFATDGRAGDPLGHYANCDYQEMRRVEARKAAEILGVIDLTFWEYQDGKLAEADGVDDRLARLFAAERPDLIYRPSARETHPDHWGLAVAVDRALATYRCAVAAYAYEVWATVQPTHIIDITAVWELKQKAIEQYQSQIVYNDYLHKVAGLNAYRAAIYLPSARYVEAFEAR